MPIKSAHISHFYSSLNYVHIKKLNCTCIRNCTNMIFKLCLAFVSYNCSYLRFYQYCNFYFLKLKVRKTETAIHSNKTSINYFDLTINNIVPVLKLTTMSMRKMVSDRQLNAIHRVDKSSLKKEMATGKTMRLATNSISIHKSQ